MNVNACPRVAHHTATPEPAAAATSKPYIGAFIGEIPARAFGLASVLVPDREAQHRGNPLWVWAVLSAAERLTGRSYYLGLRGVRVESQARTIPVARPDSSPSASTATATFPESNP